MVQPFRSIRQQEYEQFYNDNYRRVLHYVQRKISCIEDAEDLTSDVFLYCFDHFEDYNPAKSSITTWLYLIVNSRVKNYYRDHVSFADYEQVSDFLVDSSFDLDQGVYIEQLHNALMDAIHSLPERQKEIVMLRYFDNYSHEEIAKKLGITPVNTRVLLSRALNKLTLFNASNWKEFIHNG